MTGWHLLIWVRSNVMQDSYEEMLSVVGGVWSFGSGMRVSYESKGWIFMGRCYLLACCDRRKGC